MKKIYIADDEKSIRDIISSFLRNSNYDVECFEDGDSLWERFENQTSDMVILDVMMPGMDGFELCTKIRSKSNVPIIMVSAKDTEMDRITGITMGADDYMVKPFSPMELVVRVNGIFRRFESFFEEKTKKSLEFGDIYMDLNLKTCVMNEDNLDLTPTEFALLGYLIENSTRAVSREELLKNIWKLTFETDTRATDDVLKRLRKKLQKSNVRIKAVWGFGFKLELEDNI